MKIAFYAPMKSPEHGVPSGDRTIARSLLSALRRTGADVTLASAFQCRDGRGDRQVQDRIINEAGQEAARLAKQGEQQGWGIWVTYHNYYKAPDLLGPTVSQTLGIPYVQIESTRAKKRLSGNWATFAQAAEAATDRADLVFYFTNRDAEALRDHAPDTQHLCHLPPFLDREEVNPHPSAGARILAVGMMRERDKLQSYTLIAETLTCLAPRGWTLDVVGDGPVRDQIEALFRPFGSNIHFLGALPPSEMALRYTDYGILLWPGVNEAFGMVYLEAQAAGLAIVAQNRPGVRDVLPKGEHPTPEEGPDALATRLQDLLASPAALARAKAASLENASRHVLPAAVKALRTGLAEIGVVI